MMATLPSPADARDHLAALPQVAIPPFVDLKPSVFEVENQMSFNACTANAGCSALELMYKAKGRPVDLSRMYLYHAMRELEGTVQSDQGAYPRDIGRALLNTGVCKESTWGYSADHLMAAPTTAADTEAAMLKIVSYEYLPGGLADIKNAIAQGIPVLLTIEIHQGIYNQTGAWQTHNWDTSTPIMGYHEVLVIGYDDASKRLLAENSWGPDYGDGGFFGIPYEMTLGEAWVLTPNYEAAFTPDGLPPPAPTPSRITQVWLNPIWALVAVLLIGWGLTALNK